MKLSLILAAFSTVLVAELGCTARGLALVARTGSPGAVIAGTLLANAVLLLPLYLGGDWLHRIGENPLFRLFGAVVFFTLGIQLLLHRH